MNFSVTLFPAPLHLAAHLLFLLVLAHALWSAPWKRLSDSEQLNVFLGSCVGLLLIWSLKAGLHPGMHHHLLGATLFVLMFGWQFALIGLSLVLAGSLLNGGGGEWQGYSINALVLIALPVGFSELMLRLALRFLPHHFFIYTLVNGFATAGAAMALATACSALLLVTWGPYDLSTLGQKYLPYSAFMVFGEAFFTGMLSTSLVLFRPTWITTFDDHRYLDGK